MTIPDPVPPRLDTRVVSYNVLYQGVAPVGHEWDERRDAVTAELRRLSPDVIAFQEVWREQFSDLQNALPEFSWVAATGTPAHTPIAYRTDQFKTVQSGTKWLAPSGANPGTPAWDAAYQRLATYAVLVGNDRTVTVLNVHLDHEGEQARLRSVDIVRELLAAVASDTVILAGDFNCQPGDPAHHRATGELGDHSLSDATAVAETTAGPTVTYTGFEEESEQPQHIDHVLVSEDIDVERVVTCVPQTAPDRRPSDHRPVLADLSY